MRTADALITAGNTPAVASLRRNHTAPTPTTQPQQPWRRSVLPQNTAVSNGVAALARRFGHSNVAQITASVFPQAGTSVDAPR
jgi:hypothetical protein